MHAERIIRPALTATLAALMITMLASAGCSHKTVDQYLSAGDQALQANNLGNAGDNYRAAEKIAPNDPRTHTAMGSLYVLENKPDQARAEYVKALELNPKDAAAHAALGDIYAREKQYSAAENQYRAALTLKPSNAQFHTELGLILQAQGKLKDAEGQYRTAIGLDPRNAHAHLDLAQLLNVQPGRRAEAAAEFAQVRALDPSLVPAGAPTVAAAAPAATAKPLKIKNINKRFRVFHNSPVYAQPDASSKVVAHVHTRGYVRVTGIAGKWLRVKMRSGVVGFIPIAAAE